MTTGPTNLTHQYTGEREILDMKRNVHSGSAPNENISNNSMEKELMKVVPLVVKNSELTQTLGCAVDGSNSTLYDVSDDLKYLSSDYDKRYMLKHPHRMRILTPHEQNRLAEFHRKVRGLSGRRALPRRQTARNLPQSSVSPAMRMTSTQSVPVSSVAFYTTRLGRTAGTYVLPGFALGVFSTNDCFSLIPVLTCFFGMPFAMKAFVERTSGP